jgi:hypothetical protein
MKYLMLANHGAQRMSGQLQQVIGAGVSVATSGRSEQTQQIWNRLWCWVTSSDVTFSRNHETEIK